MELRHLRHFVAVAEELHFARAAERLGMEQSPLSHSIRNLEAELSTKLFHRTTRRTWLTRAGLRFFADARRILGDVDAAAISLRAEGEDWPGTRQSGIGRGSQASRSHACCSSWSITDRRLRSRRASFCMETRPGWSAMVAQTLLWPSMARTVGGWSRREADRGREHHSQSHHL